jgi:hypothetical protein
MHLEAEVIDKTLFSYFKTVTYLLWTITHEQYYILYWLIHQLEHIWTEET